MRRSWDEPADESLDEPVTLTARQLRSLKWGARLGLFALILAVAAAGLAGWTMVRAAKEGSQTNANVASAAEKPGEGGMAEAATPTTAPSAPAPAATSAPTPAASAPTPAASAPAPAATAPAPAQTTAAAPTKSKTTKTRHAARFASVGTAKHGTSAHSPKPVTESFDPSPSPATPAVSPTPSPIPITPEAAKPAAKPAAKDSSAAP